MGYPMGDNCLTLASLSLDCPSMPHRQEWWKISFLKTKGPVRLLQPKAVLSLTLGRYYTLHSLDGESKGRD